jgi:glycosyltransferase involved in cell wall biosynthesis
MRAPVHMQHLGSLRNYSQDQSTGDVLCSWDDDDLYHPERIERQVKLMLAEGSQACFIRECLHYFEDTKALYASYWARGISPSRMCIREYMPRYIDHEEDPEGKVEKSIDTPVVEQIQARLKVSYIEGDASLYTRTFHGKNLWDRDHHQGIIDKTILPASHFVGKTEEMGARLREYLPFPKPYVIKCRDGEHITL